MRNLSHTVLLFLFSCFAFAQTPTYTALFDFNKSSLTTIEKEKLNTWFSSMKDKNIKSIKLVGHCDSIGSYNYNLLLSKKRASIVKRNLHTNRPIEINYKSFNFPIESNTTGSGRAKNRRVDIFITYNKLNCQIISSNTRDSISITTYTNQTKREITLLPQNSFNAEETQYMAIHQKGSLPRTLSNEELNCPITLNSIVVNQRFTLSKTYFIPNTPKFMDDAYLELNNLLYTMQENPTLYIKLEGHTNGVATKKDPAWHYNMSTQRAKAVTDFLIKNKIESTRITYKGYGCDRMINPQGNTPEARTANRRVEVLITKY